jgi:hypothetical protein
MMMKQTFNISVLVIVLSIPFALSQTRKAIPVGRYEALSGIKVSHGQKNIENTVFKDSHGFFWGEVLKYIPQNKNDNFYFNLSAFDSSVKSFLLSKGVREVKAFDQSVNILLSDNLTRDTNIFKKIKAQGSLIVLSDRHALKEVMSLFGQYEVVIYQADADNNLYLLKHK